MASANATTKKEPPLTPKGKRVLAPVAAGAGVALLYGVVAEDIVVKFDPGGDIRALYQQYYEEWDEGRNRHVIAGRCASACTMRLAFPNTCRAVGARLGFHKAYYVDFFGLKIGSPWGTQYMMDRYPDEIKEWLKSKGGISHDMKWLQGEELARLVPACKALDNHARA